jgi:hypothetical protein
MSLILKNRTVFNSLYELDKTCFTKTNTTLVNANKVYPNIAADVEVAPTGVLGGTVAALKDGASYTVVPADGTNQPIGLFVNNAFGNPFDNSPAVASGKIAIAQKLASVEVDIYEDEEFAIGDKLYASANGYLTKTAGSNATVIGIVTKLPTAADPFLGLEMSI